MAGRPIKERCVVEGCNKEVVIKKHKLCRTHYLYYVRGSTELKVLRKHKAIPAYSPDLTKV